MPERSRAAPAAADASASGSRGGPLEGGRRVGGGERGRGRLVVVEHRDRDRQGDDARDHRRSDQQAAAAVARRPSQRARIEAPGHGLRRRALQHPPPQLLGGAGLERPGLLHQREQRPLLVVARRRPVDDLAEALGPDPAGSRHGRSTSCRSFERARCSPVPTAEADIPATRPASAASMPSTTRRATSSRSARERRPRAARRSGEKPPGCCGPGHRLGHPRRVALLARPAAAVLAEVIERHPPRHLHQPHRGAPPRPGRTAPSRAARARRWPRSDRRPDRGCRSGGRGSGGRRRGSPLRRRRTRGRAAGALISWRRTEETLTRSIRRRPAVHHIG